MEQNGQQAKSIYSWVHNLGFDDSDSSNNCAFGVDMIHSKLTSRYLYFLLAIAILLTLFDISVRILYACIRLAWLKWSMQGSYIAILGFVLVIGFPWWLGARCDLHSRRNAFFVGSMFNFIVGIIGNIMATLQWRFFLVKCMPNIYATMGGQQAIMIAWLVLAVEVVLGGIASMIGQKKTR